jgi:hypothetical protein
MAREDPLARAWDAPESHTRGLQVIHKRVEKSDRAASSSSSLFPLRATTTCRRAVFAPRRRPRSVERLFRAKASVGENTDKEGVLIRWHLFPQRLDLRWRATNDVSRPRGLSQRIRVMRETALDRPFPRIIDLRSVAARHASCSIANVRRCIPSSLAGSLNRAWPSTTPTALSVC